MWRRPANGNEGNRWRVRTPPPNPTIRRVRINPYSWYGGDIHRRNPPKHREIQYASAGRRKHLNRNEPESSGGAFINLPYPTSFPSCTVSCLCVIVRVEGVHKTVLKCDQCRANMVHSSTVAAQGGHVQFHVAGVRDHRDLITTSSPGGIPKSPSFHSGLDLVASASVDSLCSAAADPATLASPVAGKMDGQTTNGGATFVPRSTNPFVDDGDVTVDRHTMQNGANNAAAQNNNGGGGGGGGGVSVSVSVPFSVQSAQTKNCNAVNTLQAFGHLPLLKGTSGGVQQDGSLIYVQTGGLLSFSHTLRDP